MRERKKVLLTGHRDCSGPLVMGVSSGKFSVTRLTVTTVLTTTEVIRALSAMHTVADKIMIKYHLLRPCGSGKVLSQIVSNPDNSPESSLLGSPL